MTQNIGSERIHLWHVLVTRFSYRAGNDASSQRKAMGFEAGRQNFDPLDPDRLELRCATFELACAPSILAQTSQDFDWIIIIDKLLSAHYRDRVLQCVADRPRTHLHEFSASEELSRSDWLARYAPANATHLVTTNLDDDDALPSNFVSALHSSILRAESLPPLMTLGVKSGLYWELLSTKKSPLGYRCSAFFKDLVRASGFTLLCRYPNGGLTVFSISHVLADSWFTLGDCQERDKSGLLKREISYFRTTAGSVLDSAIVWAYEQKIDPFIDLSEFTGPVVLTNHFANDQTLRLLARKPDRRPVTGSRDFPGTALRLDRFHGHSVLFRKSLRVLRQQLRQVDYGDQISFARRLRQSIWMVWRFAHL